MKTYHIHKANCFKASRVILQAEWDEEPVFVHRGKNAAGPSIPSGRFQGQELGVIRMARIIISQQRMQQCSFVFHAQSSLVFLHFARVLICVLRRKYVTIVYDIHDFHEKTIHSGLWRKVRYGWLRYLILLHLERIALSAASVKTMTVSAGLAAEISKCYKCPPPAVVMSAHAPTGEFRRRFRHSGGKPAVALYFGTVRHAPPSVLVQQLVENGVSLHIYGRDIPDKFYERQGVCPAGTEIRYFGEYHPEDMEFLRRYRYVILFSHLSDNVNYRCALPNKLFQGMAEGLSFIVSPNFHEVIRVLEIVPGAVRTVQRETEVIEAIMDIDNERGESYEEALMDLLVTLNESSKSCYLTLTRGDNKAGEIAPSLERWSQG